MKETTSDEIMFMGQVILRLNPSQRITSSNKVEWLPSRGMMIFWDGCLLDDGYHASTRWVFEGNDASSDRFIPLDNSPDVHETPLSSVALSADCINVWKIIKQKNSTSLPCQYIALNMKVLNPADIVFMLITGNGFKFWPVYARFFSRPRCECTGRSSTKAG